MKPKEIGVLLFFILISQAAGFVGSLFTITNITSWYATINKPFFNPPNWIFGPVWISLYFLMGLAAYFIWKQDFSKKPVKIALSVFGLQLALNTIWSILFFGLQTPFYAFIEIIILWIAIAYTTKLFYKLDKKAAYIMIPYICWVSFAAILNLSIWLLN